MNSHSEDLQIQMILSIFISQEKSVKFALPNPITEDAIFLYMIAAFYLCWCSSRKFYEPHW